jgi:hypothetical protein
VTDDITGRVVDVDAVVVVAVVVHGRRDDQVLDSGARRNIARAVALVAGK